ncbi:hypothetical protein MKJ01_18205 [Chryseobacterium sp. SSA4.19]|uniref:hypothetical protein n=1 Tax=Chryseobacterium sp. SSA4.19 TaxID=2919915 RepID=UPI001F4E015A|nr:hypothetical protein [Chryseobacterium sp. SSA4.19]MCJ8155691.1 hypothetical protein [Chryseobacterium sp. SSA4.19]
MNYSKLSQRQTLFLYAFLRQIDRSLDKSRWTSITELKTYYKDRISPEQIIHYLQTHFTIVKENSYETVNSSNLTFKDKFRMFFQRNYLTAEELTHLYDLLLAFDQYLKSDLPYSTEIEILRIDIARFYSKVLASRISGRNLKKLMFTEHYEQNRLVKPFELKKLVPKNFYESKMIN